MLKFGPDKEGRVANWEADSEAWNCCGLKGFFSRRRIELLLFALTTINGAYFYNGFGWNSIARLDAIFAAVEPGAHGKPTLHIDRFIFAPELGKNTGDWSYNPDHNPHYYSNKGPGTTFMGVPFYWLIYGIERFIGLNPISGVVTRVNAYLLNLGLSVLPWGIGIICFYWTILRLHPERPRWAAGLAVTMSCGTLVFPYSTHLVGHSTTAALIACACYCITRDGPKLAWLGGFCVGLAVCVEYTAAIAAITFPLWLFRQERRRAIWFCLGGLVPFLGFCAYHKVCFGGFFATATAFNNPLVISVHEVSGQQFGWPSARVFWMLTFHPYRGLFWHMPVLLFIIPAVWQMRSSASSGLGKLALFNILGLFLVNSTFGAWHGGPVIGARYLILSLPFYGIVISYFRTCGWRISRAMVRAGFILMCGLSIMNMLVIAAISPMAPRVSDLDAEQGTHFEWSNPLAIYYRMFIEGQLHSWVIRPIRAGEEVTEWYSQLGTFNLAQLAGLQGSLSVLPWMIVVGGILILICRSNDKLA